MSKAGVIIKLLVFGVVVSIIGGVYFQIDSGMNKAPKHSPDGQHSIEVLSGETLQNLSQKLEEADIINNKFWFMIKSKSYTIEPLQVGAYFFDVPALPSDIFRQINDETERLFLEAEKYRRPVVENVLIREGSNIDVIISILVENNISTEEELKNYAQDFNNFVDSEYEFLPEPLSCNYGDLSNCAKYYLEGYLYPDTYNFFADATAQEAFDVMLSNFDIKVWQKIKEQVKSSDKTFEDVVILASVLEKETGRTRGITEETLGDVNEERQIMAGVFNNRNAIGMKWGSDVTLEYGHDRKLCQQTFEVPNCIYINDPLTNTKYNTYKNTGYPIGPVSNPQYYNIYAALNPIQEDQDYLYFVSDVVGRKYFSKNETEFQQSIARISEINRKLESED